MDNTVFTDILRRKTARVHSVSDALVNLRLVSVLVDRELYAKSIACFYFVLKKIEDELENQGKEDSRIADFVKESRELFRSQAIQKDLEYFLGPSWHSIAVMCSKRYAEGYINHIELKMPNRICIVIHAYTQLAAFASGGRILARKVLLNTLLNADERGKDNDIDSVPEGLHAFQYEKKEIGELKNSMKRALNALAPHLSEEEQASIIQEHALVFKLNNDIITSFKVGFLPSAKAYTNWICRKIRSGIYSKTMAYGCVVVVAGILALHQMSTSGSERNLRGATR